MQALLDFFAVRPVFTLYGLRVLWGAYLVDQVLPFIGLLTSPRVSASAAALFALIFRACLNVAIFRLLIEVAASVLLGRPNSYR